MAQSTEIALGTMLRSIFAHLRKYLVWILVFTATGFLLTLFLSSDFQAKYSARGIFTSADSDLKADFIYFKSLSEQYEQNKNSEIITIYLHQLTLDDGRKALDIIIHLQSASEEVVQNFNKLVLSRNLKVEVPFMLNKQPILSKFSVLLSGFLISLFVAILLSIFVDAWRMAGK